MSAVSEDLREDANSGEEEEQDESTMTESEIQSHVPKPSSDGSGDGQRDAGQNADVEQYIRNCRKYQTAFDDASIASTLAEEHDIQWKPPFSPYLASPICRVVVHCSASGCSLTASS
eukprot:6567-Heterococcus_DN1.PRE.1